MFNFYYAPDIPGYQEYKAQVRRIFDLIKAGKFEPYTSIFTTDEIDNDTNQEKREKMWQLITDYGVKILPVNDEVE
jgi:hypothetical protein